MLKSRYIDKICIGAIGAAVILTILFMFGQRWGLQKVSGDPDYARLLFDNSRVHTIDIRIDNWKELIEEAEQEEYRVCTVNIDGEFFRQVGIRAKGNNSLHLTDDYDLARYSLKLEFDHFTSGGSYYGLDKFSLDASFQDNSYLKTSLAYDMMRFMGVPAPLCSYVWVTVNGQDWGLFLAVEEPEEGFARRNFGKNHGQLYKPDYRSLEDENRDVALKYSGEEFAAYDNIFRNAKFEAGSREKKRVIEALHALDRQENLELYFDVDQILRYFTVQVFVMNWDSYIGYTGHNYYLYEEDGRLSILPWDYNLAFGTYALGMPRPVEDPAILIHYPIDTPAEGDVMQNRPLYHHLMQEQEYFTQYHTYFEQLIRDYFNSGRFRDRLYQTAQMIAPYVEKDPTAFCGYEDFKAAVDMLFQVCINRAKSVDLQLRGKLPSTLAEQENFGAAYPDVSHIDLNVLGDFDDLETAPKVEELFS